MTEVKLPTHGRFRNLTGQKFGRLRVISFKGMENSRAVWNFECDCGKNLPLIGHNVQNGHTQSCGCFMIDQTKASNTRHGADRVGQRTPEYKAWVGMNRRCNDEKEPSWNDYGGRGIKVCDEWKEDFPAFLAALGIKPSSKHSLDRFPDTNGNYEPGNVRWATDKEQARNKRNNRMFTIDEKTQCLAAWSEEYSINQDTVWMRLNSGWEIIEALTRPINKRKANGVKVEFRGEMKTKMELSKEFNISFPTLNARLKLGWDLEKALTHPIDQLRKPKHLRTA